MFAGIKEMSLIDAQTRKQHDSGKKEKLKQL